MAKKKANVKRAVGSTSPMDIGLLEEMTRLMKEHDLNTVDVRDGDKRVILKRGAIIASSGSSGFAPPFASLPTASVGPSPAASAATKSSSDEEANLIPIKSPMVGTFYTSSSPDAKAFVSVGSTVDEETDVCIIEAMKVFNNIKAECKGTIAKVVVENGSTVEFGQVLYLVKP